MRSALSRRLSTLAITVATAVAGVLLVPGCGAAPEPTSSSDHGPAPAVAPPVPAASASPEYGSFGQCYNGLMWCDSNCKDDIDPSCYCECHNAYCECTGKCQLEECVIY